MTDVKATTTQALRAYREGDPRAADVLLPAMYDRLRRVASHMMGGERPDHTLRPTELVHEAYLRLIQVDRIDWRDRAHFFAMAATQMRRILVEHARRRAAGKRGGGLTRVSLNELGGTRESSTDLIALDEALSTLASRNGRHSRVAELRLFAGLQTDEIAEALGVSERTVKRDWRVARAWLARELA